MAELPKQFNIGDVVTPKAQSELPDKRYNFGGSTISKSTIQRYGAWLEHKNCWRIIVGPSGYEMLESEMEQYVDPIKVSNPLYKVGLKVRHKRTHKEDVVLSYPGMIEYDSKTYGDKEIGFVLKTSAWQYTENWETVHVPSTYYVGMKMRNLVDGGIDYVTDYPGTTTYDSRNFSSAEYGFILKSNMWCRTKDWEPVDELGALQKTIPDDIKERNLVVYKIGDMVTVVRLGSNDTDHKWFTNAIRAPATYIVTDVDYERRYGGGYVLQIGNTAYGSTAVQHATSSIGSTSARMASETKSSSSRIKEGDTVKVLDTPNVRKFNKAAIGFTFVLSAHRGSSQSTVDKFLSGEQPSLQYVTSGNEHGVNYLLSDLQKVTPVLEGFRGTDLATLRTGFSHAIVSPTPTFYGSPKSEATGYVDLQTIREDWHFKSAKESSMPVRTMDHGFQMRSVFDRDTVPSDRQIGLPDTWAADMTTWLRKISKKNYVIVAEQTAIVAKTKKKAQKLIII